LYYTANRIIKFEVQATLENVTTDPNIVQTMILCKEFFDEYQSSQNSQQNPQEVVDDDDGIIDTKQMFKTDCCELQAPATKPSVLAGISKFYQDMKGEFGEIIDLLWNIMQ